MAVTKHEIVNKIINNVGLSRTQSVDLVENLLEIMKSSIEKEDHILISGFCKFSVKKKKERVGRNPATGSTMMLKPRKVVTFQHSTMLKDLINR